MYQESHLGEEASFAMCSNNKISKLTGKQLSPFAEAFRSKICLLITYVLDLSQSKSRQRHNKVLSTAENMKLHCVRGTSDSVLKPHMLFQDYIYVVLAEDSLD